MKLDSILNITAELLDKALSDRKTPENFASVFFRKNKFIGSSERKLISGLLFTSLRHYKTSLFFSDHYDIKNNPVIIIKVSVLLSIEVYSTSVQETFSALFKKAAGLKDLSYKTIFLNDLHISSKSISKFKTLLDRQELSSAEDFEKFYSLPYYIGKKLLHKYDGKTLRSIAYSTLNPADVFIRPNNIKSSVPQISNEFQDHDVSHSVQNEPFFHIKLLNRKQLNHLKAYRNGEFEIQDLSSQLVSGTIKWNENDDILDACAGAGGKSLFLASSSLNKLNIYAYDINQRKLKELEKRKEKTGSFSIHVLNRDELESKKFDTVIIDAPCSGSGTLSRNPALKYKLNDKLLQNAQKLQIDILHDYSKYLKTGGILYYITCSVLPEENEENIKLFLNDNPKFVPDLLDSDSIPNPENYYYHTILPEAGSGDGFFVAKLKKIK